MANSEITNCDEVLTAFEKGLITYEEAQELIDKLGSDYQERQDYSDELTALNEIL